MSKLTGLFRKQRGSIDDVTFRQVHGQTVVSVKSLNPAQPRTPAQMRNRICWRNVQNIWAAFTGTLHPSFESRPRTWSDANAFMSANIGRVRVYLTKSLAEMGAAVVAPYQITRGSLPSIHTQVDGTGIIVSNIEIADLELDETTNISALSEAIINNNEGWQYGDQISAFMLTQSVNSVTHVPYVTVQAFEITLSQEAVPISTLYAQPYPFTNKNGKIGMYAAIDGAVAYVHSRKEASKTRVSTQELVVTSTVAANYTNAAAYAAALESYGGKTEQPFLTPNIDDELAPQP